MLKQAVDKLEAWGQWLFDKPLWLLPLTIWPMVLIFLALIHIMFWLKITGPFRKTHNG